MTLDKLSEDGKNLQLYVQKWENLGFDTSFLDSKTDQMTPTDFEQIEERIQTIQNLKERISSFDFLPETQKMLDKLIHPMNYEDVEQEFGEWVARKAPWEPGYYRWYANWSEKGETKERYWEIVSICTKLDESSWASVNLLLPLLSNPDNYTEIINALEQVKADEKRQRLLLEKATTLLEEKGYTVDISSENIIDQFNQMEQLQYHSSQVDLLRLEIQTTIFSFDPTLAETFEKRLNDAVKNPSVDIKTIADNITTISEHLQIRLNEMNALIHRWGSEGYTYHGRTQITPDELLEWEQILPEVEQQYHRHVAAHQRWNELSKAWDLADISIEQTIGKIEHTDDFLDKIESVEQEWTEKELQCASIIERWEQLGFEMDVWRYKIDEDPSKALTELKQHQQMYERANEQLENLLQLDTSLGGEGEVEQRTNLLRSVELDNQILDKIESWIEKKTVRNARHRRMLQSEWEQAVRKGKANPDQSFQDLYSFEEALASLENNAHKMNQRISRSKAFERTKAELLRMEARGWNMGDLLHLHDQESMDFFHHYSRAIDATSRIQTIQRRLAALDWCRDVKRAHDVSIDVRNPLELVRIEQKIPAMIRHLSTRPIEDKSYKYTVWLPEQRPILLPEEQSRTNKVLLPVQPETTLEEAHEAMLEAMEEGANREAKVPHSQSNDATQSKPQSIPDKPQNLDDENVLVVRPPLAAKPAPTLVVASTLSSYETLFRLLGLSDEADALIATRDINPTRRKLASLVGVEPRDLRVDRLLRLVLRLLPQNDDNDTERAESIDMLVDVLPNYKQWVRMRLEARYTGSTGNFFEDAERLGSALDRTPGPGVRVPLQADVIQLPEISNVDELRRHTERLVQSMNPVAAGGIN